LGSTLGFNRTFSPTSGTGVFNILRVSSTINQTGGANGITRGLYINPTLTAADDFRAIESTNGKIIISDTSTVTGSNATSLLDLSQTWNTSGTPSAIKLNITDTTSNGSSFLLDLRVANTQLFGVTKGGLIAFGGAFGSTGALIGTSAGTLNFYHKNTTAAAYGFDFRPNSGVMTATSSESGLINIRQTFAPTSGTATFNAINLSPNLIISQSGGANGITRGIYINPTLTAAADFRAIETTSGSVSFNHGSTPLLFVSSSGNVGIGTSTPDSYYAKKLVISSTDESGITIAGTSTSATNYLAFADGTSGNQAYRGYISYKHLSDQLAFGSGGTLRATIDSAGNFGVGTSTNTILARTHIAGSGTTSATTALRVENTNASASLVVLDNGFVGINTGSAAFNLDVNGTARVSGQTTLSGIGNTSSTLALTTQNSDAVQMFAVRNDGGLRLNSTSTGTTIFPYASDENTLSITGRNIAFSSAITTQGSRGVIAISGVSFTAITGTSIGFGIYKGFAPTSGAGVFDFARIEGTINQTGGANGITRGLYINPTLTAAADFRAIETTNGKVIFSGTGSVTISNVLTLTPQSPLPSGVATGSFAVSSSVPPKPYFYDGTTWNALY